MPEKVKRWKVTVEVKSPPQAVVMNKQIWVVVIVKVLPPLYCLTHSVHAMLITDIIPSLGQQGNATLSEFSNGVTLLNLGVDSTLEYMN